MFVCVCMCDKSENMYVTLCLGETDGNSKKSECTFHVSELVASLCSNYTSTLTWCMPTYAHNVCVFNSSSQTPLFYGMVLEQSQKRSHCKQDFDEEQWTYLPDVRMSDCGAHTVEDGWKAEKLVHINVQRIFVKDDAALTLQSAFRKNGDLCASRKYSGTLTVVVCQQATQYVIMKPTNT